MLVVPRWQFHLHWTTELASVLAVPFVFAAARQLPEPHRTRLRLLGWGALIVDGFLLFRWLQLLRGRS